MMYLVRHGVTQWNLDKKIQGITDIPLHEKGKEQARILGEKLAHEGEYSIIFSSPLLRAYETAQIIREYCDVPLVTNALLQEIDFGKWDKRKTDSFKGEERKDFEQWLKNPTLVSPPEGETVYDVQNRIRLFLHGNNPSRYTKPVIVVCHQIVGAVLTCTLKKEDLSVMPDYYMKNTDFRVISTEEATVLRDQS